MRLLELILVCSSLFVACAVSANEGGGGGEGGGEAAKKEEKKSAPEWAEIQNRLGTLKAKVGAKEKIVRELIEEKRKEKDPRKSVEIVENLKREHKELREAAEEYEQQRNLLKYRFPEKGLQEEQRYRRVEVRSLDEMEKQISVEGQLGKTMGKIRQQYGSVEPVETMKNEKESESSTTSPRHSIVEPPVMAK